MRDRVVAVLSGINTRVIDRFARQLRANGVESAFVAFDGAVDQAYFDRLLMQTLNVLARSAGQENGDLSLLLVSAIDDQKTIEFEENVFFPAARRLAVKAEWRNNPLASDRIRDAILQFSQDRNQKAFTRGLRRNAKFLLPVINASCKSLAASYRSLFYMQTLELSRKTNRDVVSLKGSKGLRINGVDFCLAVNNGRHPVRRVTPTDRCDLAGAFRFGASVESRLEFDVTCEGGLRSKRFYQCDGEPTVLSKEPSHLNMRINDDHAVG